MENRLLGNAPFFAALPESDRARVAERMHLDRRTKGDWLFRRGEPSSELYLIQSGWVQLLGEGGTVIASLGPGSLVGEADLFLERPHSVGASLAGDGELWGITRNDLADLISDHPSIGVELSLAFGARLAAMERHLVERRLRALPALAGLGDAGLSALAHCLQLRERRAGERIVGRGQALQGLFLVESGQVAQDGAPLGAGQAFGEMALLMHRPHACEVVAQSDVVLWVLPAADFDVLCERHPEVRLALSRNLREPLTCDDQSRAGARLARMPLFSNASPEILAAAAERMWVRHVPAGELIYAEGTQGDALYLIDSGQVQIAASARPQSQVLATLAQDEFFGEMALLTGKPRSTAARAVAPTNLWGLNRADFDSLVSRYPAISLALTRVLSDRLAEADRRYTEDHLRGQKVLAGLSSSQLEDINRRLRPVHFDWGEIILNEGEPGDEMYFIQSGRVRVIRGRGRDARRLAELGAGELFGEMALLTGSRRTATVVAASDVNAWALARPDFDELVERYSSLALGLSRLLSERLRATDERLQEEEPAPQAVRPARAPAEPRPAPARPQPRPAARAQAERREPRPGLLDQAQDAVGSAAAWFGSLSRGAKVRLVALCLLLIWLFLIAAPAVVITALAANDVSDLSGAIAFVRSGSPQVAEPQAALAVQQPVQATAAPLLEQPAEALR